jgi:hypothetical protein
MSLIHYSKRSVISSVEYPTGLKSNMVRNLQSFLKYTV